MRGEDPTADSKLLKAVEDLLCRQLAVSLCEQPEIRGISVAEPVDGADLPLQIEVSRPGDALRFVFKEMPEPTLKASLENILLFKSNYPESSGKVAALQGWFRRLIDERVSPSDIINEFGSLKDKYERQMELDGIQIDHGAVEILMTATVGRIKELVEYASDNQSKILFQLSHAKMDLLVDGELNAPHRPVAYVSRRKRQ